MTPALRIPANVSFRDRHPDLGDGRASIIAGLNGAQKQINPMWLYDEHGSVLFDAITRLPEYYPTRTEIAILSEHRGAISVRCGQGCLLLEPGAGSSEKVRLLLDTLRPARYLPIDISADFLRASAMKLGAEYPWLRIDAVCADFNAGWEFLADLPAGKRVVFYPGSTIGNLEPEAARQFLATLAELIGADGGVLIGVDRHKDRDVLHAAYNDSAGVTAAFNLNVLTRLNTLLDADFNPDRFTHHAFYNEALRRIEMHLVSRGEQVVRCGNQRLTFMDAESIHSENSYKYAPEDFARLAATAGLAVVESWSDEQSLFSVHYLQRA